MSYPFAFLLIIVPLVVIHEFGHFLMCKLGGIRVTKFAFGFGHKLFGFKFKGTEYRWNLLPLGGYVDFMGDLVYTNTIPDDVSHFYNRPKWIRFLVLLMGPLFNLVLAFGIYWVYHTIEPLKTPIFLGEPCTVGYVADDGPAALAGLQIGDRITAFNGEEVSSWDDLDTTIFFNPGKEVTLTVERDEVTLPITYTIAEHKVEAYGVKGFWPNLRHEVESVQPGSPAAKAGFEPYDVISHVNGRPIAYEYMKEYTIQSLLADAAPGASRFQLIRDGQPIELEVAPELDEEERWLIGIMLEVESSKRELGFLEAFPQAWNSMKRDSTLIYRGLKKLLSGDGSLKMLSGPIGVGKLAKEALDVSLPKFLYLMALLSLNLGIMNLLPIPVLDGGEIFVLLMEGVVGRDFSLDTKLRIKLVGFFFLIGLMALVIFFDILKVFA